MVRPTARTHRLGGTGFAGSCSRLGDDAVRSRPLVCLQAGNLHSGAFDPFTEAIGVAKAHGAWVHVDGAFGLWAAAVPELAALTAGLGWPTPGRPTPTRPSTFLTTAESLSSDAQALRSAMGVHTSYLIQAADGAATRSRRSRSSPAGPAACRYGRR